MLILLLSVLIVVSIIAICKIVFCPNNSNNSTNTDSRLDKIRNLHKIANSRNHPSVNDDLWNMSYPLVLYKRYKHKDTECTICLREFTNREEIVRIKMCKHIFHKSCFEGMMRQSYPKCANCRQNLDVGGPISYDFKFNFMYQKLRKEAEWKRVEYINGLKMATSREPLYSDD